MPKKKLSFSFLASVAVHLCLAWLISFNASQLNITERKAPHVMDVVLLDESQSTNTNEANDAKVIANKNNSGNTVNAQDSINRLAKAPSAHLKQKSPKSPAPVAPEKPRTPPIPAQQNNQQNTRIITRKKEGDPFLLAPEKEFHAEQKSTSQPVPIIPLANLLPTSSALTQLSREFDRERRMKQLLSQEADIGINTRESKYAPYAQGLVASLEEQWRPAGTAIKELAQDERRVLMRVSIEHNGELGSIKILRPSPSPELNASAVEAVHKAAPFNPLPNSWGLERANFYFVFEVVEDRFVFRTL